MQIPVQYYTFINMSDGSSFLDLYSQHPVLPIRLITPAFGKIAAEKPAAFGLTHRRPNYFLVFMLAGHSNHGDQWDSNKTR